MSRQSKYKISEHFSRRDFVCQCQKCHESIRLSLGLVGGLELLRSKAKNRINVLKAYECPESAESSSRTRRNLHILGIAADITIDKKDLKETFLLAEEIPEFNGIGLDFTGGHVHVDTRKDKKRVLWVVENGIQTDLTEANRKQYFPEPESSL